MYCVLRGSPALGLTPFLSFLRARLEKVGEPMGTVGVAGYVWPIVNRQGDLSSFLLSKVFPGRLPT